MNIKEFEELKSTHIYLKENYINYEDGTVILTNRQSSGIGTKGRGWYTGNGDNIAMSILYKPKCPPLKLEGLSFKVAECLVKSISDLYNIKLSIKIPNDLMLNNKKICGILVESNIIGNKINYLIVSIGFNVNETNFPTDVKNIATSLKNEFKKSFNKTDIINTFLENLKNLITDY